MILITCFIGLGIALTEVINRYRRKSIDDLLCIPFFVFITFNIFLALVMYYSLPSLYPDLLKSQNEAQRAVIAGFGYAVILKSKILSIKIDKKEIALGPAFLYDSLSNYMLLRIKQSINNRELKIAFEIANEYPILEKYIRSINTLWFISQKKVQNEEDQKELEQLKDLRNQLVFIEKQSRKKDSYNEWVVNASFLMLKHFGNKIYVVNLLKEFN